MPSRLWKFPGITASALAAGLLSFESSAMIFADGFESPPACAQIVSDDVVVNTTWVNGPTDCDYLIVPRNADDPVAPGFAPVAITQAVLTIEPGTQIQFAENASILIDEGGGLQAVGTADLPIIFSSRQSVRGFGRGLYFGFDTLNSRIEHAELINLGRESALGAHDAAIAAAPSSGAGLTLRHTAVSGSALIGAELDEFTLLGFSDNRFFDNGLFGLRVSGPQVGQLDEASDYWGGANPNGRPFVQVEGVSSRDRIISDATWRRLNAPYFIDIAVNIESGTVSLAPGVAIVAGEGAALRVSGPGALAAVGTVDEPIIFRGEQAVPGFWEGITFFESDSSNNRFDYVTVRDGGEGSSDAAIDLDLDAFLSLTNSTIIDNNKPGVCIGFRSTLEQGDGNTFSNNAGGDVVTDC